MVGLRSDPAGLLRIHFGASDRARHSSSYETAHVAWIALLHQSHAAMTVDSSSKQPHKS